MPSNSKMQPTVSEPVLRPHALQLSGLCKAFHEVKAVVDADVDLKRGEILCLLGPSGCGKTTMLRLIAGFDAPDAGTVHIDGRLVSGLGVNETPEKRRVGMVFQDGALFPHLTVAQNIAFGLSKSLRRQVRVAEALELVDLAGYDKRYPHQLSGGQQQRVALARALAPAPDLILMDEPFSSLDAGLRGQLRAEVRAILKQRGASVVCVTHDQEEAMQLADRVAVMNQGRIEQLGTPEAVFNYPDNRFTAEFFGIADFMPAWRDGKRLACEVGSIPWRAGDHPDGELQIVVRPDCLDMDISEEGNGVVVQKEFLGGFNLYRVELASGQKVQVMQSHIMQYQPGTKVSVFLRAGHRPQFFVNGRATNAAPH